MTILRTSLAVDSGDLPLTVARAAGSGAAVVIFPSAFGVGADLEAQMEDLAAEASLVASFDPFFREDAGAAPYEEMGRIMKRIGGIDRARAERDLRAAIGWARREAGGAPVVVVGICFGGPFALLAAADGEAGGVVTWHGTRMESFLARAAEMRCPLRFHFGSADPVTPPAAIDAVRAAFAERDDVAIVVHEGATHGFTHRAGPVHDGAAERAAMASVKELVRGVRRR